jgi:hypothetical protein
VCSWAVESGNSEFEIARKETGNWKMETGK